MASSPFSFQPYIPAVSPRLKILLQLIFVAVAILGASGAYLTSIRLLDASSSQTYTTAFKYWMLLLHVLVGVVMLAPFVLFGILHYVSARHRPNRRAVRLGVWLFIVGLLVSLSGVALVRLDGLPQLRTETTSHTVVLVLHILLPFLAVVFYVQHRRAGPDINWRLGYYWGAGVGVFCAAMLALHSQDPRNWNAKGPAEGMQYFFPSEARTASGQFIPAKAMMMDEYCRKCHEDIYQDHFHSSHRFSSFNNPAYLFSVRETRREAIKREKELGISTTGTIRPSRWCAGCHDPVPFYSGAFDNPEYDDEKDITAHAGITCVTCHSITHVHGPIGNAAYTIEEALHYPFAFSENSALQWLNNQLIKAEPSFHKKTFLKPFHKSAGGNRNLEFCSTCHKVSLPPALNHYKEFLRGQNHSDSYLLSGVSGHGSRSFYYPPQAKTSCNSCHMPLKPSQDFGARDFDGSGTGKVHSHLFPAANTGLFTLLQNDPRFSKYSEGFQKTIDTHAAFLKGGADGKSPPLRIDLFAIKDGGTIDGNLTVLRPQLPKLEPGKTYLVEVVIRTLLIGHHFSQGTVDSNEIWVDFEATQGGKVIGRNGGMAGPGDTGPVDEWSHFLNVHMLDRNGNRINRRNPQDIFTPLYDHQIPPGAAQVVHYELRVPAGNTSPIELSARLRYRKFDHEYMTLVHEGKAVPKLPVVDLCADKVTLPVAGGPAVAEQASPIKPPWQRWNDYGIGCYLEGGAGSKRGELKQAAEAFRKVIASEDAAAKGHGWLNLARVLIDDTNLKEAAVALNQARDAGAPWWTVAWFNGLVNAENASRKEEFDAAVASFERILDPANQPRERGFDFSKDYVVLARLGNTLFRRSQLDRDDPAEEEKILLRAVSAFERVLALDPEDLDAHFGLFQCYDRLGRDSKLNGGTESGDSIAGIDGLAEMVDQLADRKKSSADRDRSARKLLAALEPLGKASTQPYQPRLPHIQTWIGKLRSAFSAETDLSLRSALAAVLSSLHNQTHAIFKPDELARSRTVTMYRKKNPAANHAAEAIVIYPTTRRGAPGF
jgi:tetratricopeptide (TPR) repeat protein